MGELEPMTGRYDWYEAFRQNPGESGLDWPEEADEAAEWITADRAEEWLAGLDV